MLPSSIPLQKRTLLRFFLSATRQLIPLFWKTTTTPPLSSWVSIVKDMMRVEEMIALDNDTFDKFKTLWLTWIDYSTSDALKNLQHHLVKLTLTGPFSVLHQGLLAFPLPLSIPSSRFLPPLIFFSFSLLWFILQGLRTGDSRLYHTLDILQLTVHKLSQANICLCIHIVKAYIQSMLNKQTVFFFFNVINVLNVLL